MKIVFLDAKTLGNVPNLSDLEALGDLTVHPVTQPQDTIKHLGNAQVAISNKVVISKEVMEACPNLKLICIAATGKNNVDLEEAEKRGIQVKNVVGYSTQSVNQVTFSLILSLLTQIPYYDNYIKEGEYAHSDIFTHLGRDFWQLHGKKFGIIGLGNIGKAVAKVAEAFGCEVVYHSVSGNKQDVGYKMVTLEEMLGSCDIISLHTPLTPSTNNLIDYPQLKLMKPTSLLINTARGGLINETGLAKALDEDLIGGVGLDVFSVEPLPADSPLLTVKNPEKIVLAPHIAWTSLEARQVLVDGICQNIRDFLQVE